MNMYEGQSWFGQVVSIRCHSHGFLGPDHVPGQPHGVPGLGSFCSSGEQVEQTRTGAVEEDYEGRTSQQSSG